MAVINEPLYDEDTVNLGYLKKLLGITSSGVVSSTGTTVIITKNFGATPYPPYHVNDTYMSGTKIYVCIVERLIGSFNAADWQERGTDPSGLSAYSTKTGLNTDGYTAIHGGNITTGTLSASKITTGTLDASQATISNINASNISTGTLSTSRLNSDVITTTNFSAQNINADKINAGTITSVALDAGSGALRISTGGTLRYYDSPGFLYCGGNTLNNPYVSALNVSHGYGGISFRDSTSRTDAGSQMASMYLSASSNGSFIINTDNSFNINLDSADAIGMDADNYIRISAGNTDEAGTNTGSIYVTASANINLKATGLVYVKGENFSTTTYKVVGDTTGPSSRNLKENILVFNNKKYEKALDVLRSINLYDYDYRYKLFNYNHSYGFIIDEVEEIDKDKEFFLFNDEEAIINPDKGLNHDTSGKKASDTILRYKKYDLETLVKYLLVVAKAQQTKIDKLEEVITK